MSGLAFLVRGRSVDVVAMTAVHALRETLGLGDEVVGLMRDDFVVVEGVATASAKEWAQALTAHQDWFNPNKHRFAAVICANGAVDCARNDGEWPTPWLMDLIDTDRPDLVSARESIAANDTLRAWLGASTAAGHFAVPLAVWDREDAVATMPSGRWPDSSRQYLRGVLWTLVLKADNAEAASARATEIAVTRARRQGLLIHPHMEGFAPIGSAVALDSSNA